MLICTTNERSQRDLNVSLLGGSSVLFSRNIRTHEVRGCNLSINCCQSKALTSLNWLITSVGSVCEHCSGYSGSIKAVIS